MQHLPAKTPQILDIKYLPIGSLQSDPRNARIHDKRQIKQIANSIDTFGFNVPVLIDQGRKIMAGHGRLLAAQQLGWQEIPTIEISHLTPAQQRAFAIADNRLTENSSWDEQLLSQSLAELASLDLDFSLEITGFTMAEIDLRIESLDPAPETDDPLDSVPQENTGPQICQLGDYWQLGNHRLLCGDATNPDSYRILMAEHMADMIFTDPPYNVKINGHCTGQGQHTHREFPMASGEMSVAEFTDFLSTVCTHLANNSKEGSLHYVCMDWRHAHELLAAGTKSYHELKNICVWVKDNGGMGSLYRSQHELVFVYKKGKSPHRNNVELGKFGRYRTNVWHYPGANSLSRSNQEANPLSLHPTVKPVALVADAILDCSARGDLILDPFLGSGTTLLAAERIGRVCYGMELDPLYVDMIIRRWQEYTGEIAVHQESGHSFSERGGQHE